MPDANNSDLVFSHNPMAFNKKKKKVSHMRLF